MSTPYDYRPELLRAARTAKGWTKQQLIHALRRAAATQGTTLVSDASLSRAICGWENGHHYPAQYVDLLCTVYDRPAHELGLAAAPAESTDVPDTTYPVDSAAAVDTLTALWRADLSPNISVDGLSLDENVWSAGPLRWLVAAGAEPLPAPRAPTQVGITDVETIRATITMFAEMDNRFGGGHARRALIQYLRTDVAQLLTARYSDPVGRALFATVAEGSLLAAWMSYDSAHHGLAQRYFIHALRLAQTSEDRQLAASILSAMSHQATYLGHYHHASDLARAALTGVKPHATPRLTAQFHAMEARALARLGDATGCAHALSQAATNLARQSTNDDDPDWITYFDQAELSAEFGHCFRDLGRHTQASEYAAVALSGNNVRSDFFATMVYADALLAHGEDEHACTVALQALHAGQQLKSARCLAYVAEFRARLDHLGNTHAATDFRDKASTSRLWLQNG